MRKKRWPGVAGRASARSGGLDRRSRHTIVAVGLQRGMRCAFRDSPPPASEPAPAPMPAPPR